jgi:hypothetical protein
MNALRKYLFSILLIQLASGCRFQLPPHEKLIRGWQAGVAYQMEYVDSAGRSFQYYADTIVFYSTKQFGGVDRVVADTLAPVYMCDTLAGMLERYGVNNYNITVLKAKKSKGVNFKGNAWE